MSQQLTTGIEITHKLVIHIEKEGRYKTLLLTEAQAGQIAEAINSPQRFITITKKEIDAGAPVFYPKNWCYLESLTAKEREDMARNYYQEGADVESERKDREQAEKKFRIDAWIVDHPKEWNKKMEDVKKELTEQMPKVAENPHFPTLVKARARALLGEELTKIAG